MGARGPGASWGGFHGRDSGQPQIASLARTASDHGDKQGWPRWGGGGRGAEWRVGYQGLQVTDPAGSRPLTQSHVFQTNTRPWAAQSRGRRPARALTAWGIPPPQKPRPWPSLGRPAGQAEGAVGGRLALTGGPEAAQAPARPLRRTSRPLFTTLC